LSQVFEVLVERHTPARSQRLSVAAAADRVLALLAEQQQQQQQQEAVAATLHLLAVEEECNGGLMGDRRAALQRSPPPPLLALTCTLLHLHDRATAAERGEKGAVVAAVERLASRMIGEAATVSCTRSLWAGGLSRFTFASTTRGQASHKTPNHPSDLANTSNTGFRRGSL
jgi:hypothetical protein